MCYVCGGKQRKYSTSLTARGSSRYIHCSSRPAAWMDGWMDESRVAAMHSVRGNGLDGGDGNGSGQSLPAPSYSSAVRSSPDRIHGVAAFWWFRPPLRVPRLRPPLRRLVRSTSRRRCTGILLGRQCGTTDTRHLGLLSTRCELSSAGCGDLYRRAFFAPWKLQRGRLSSKAATANKTSHRVIVLLVENIDWWES